MLVNLGFDQVPLERVEARMCALLVQLREARKADHVRDDDRHELPLNALL
jgi:hypothetical protein